FVPHLIMREHWVRTNGVHSALSQPQLMWADAVYFRELAWVMDRLRTAPSAKLAEARLAAMLAILLVYGRHGYAAEIVAKVRAAAIVATRFLDEADRSIGQSMIGLAHYTLRGFLALVMALCVAAPLSLIGSRGQGFARCLSAAQAAPLFDELARAARRTGLNRICLPDDFNIVASHVDTSINTSNSIQTDLFGRRLLIVEEALRDYIGHWFEYVKSVAEINEAAGVEVT